MKNVNTTVQIKQKGLAWEETPKVKLTFKDFTDIAIYAYRLTLQTNSEVRIEESGNGHYYSPLNAENYLKTLV